MTNEIGDDDNDICTFFTSQDPIFDNYDGFDLGFNTEPITRTTTPSLQHSSFTSIKRPRSLSTISSTPVTSDSITKPPSKRLKVNKAPTDFESVWESQSGRDH
jgi:hypothetical protein